MWVLRLTLLLTCIKLANVEPANHMLIKHDEEDLVKIKSLMLHGCWRQTGCFELLRNCSSFRISGRSISKQTSSNWNALLTAEAREKFKSTVTLTFKSPTEDFWWPRGDYSFTVFSNVPPYNLHITSGCHGPSFLFLCVVFQG